MRTVLEQRDRGNQKLAEDKQRVEKKLKTMQGLKNALTMQLSTLE